MQLVYDYIQASQQSGRLAEICNLQEAIIWSRTDCRGLISVRTGLLDPCLLDLKWSFA